MKVRGPFPYHFCDFIGCREMIAASALHCAAHQEAMNSIALDDEDDDYFPALESLSPDASQVNHHSPSSPSATGSLNQLT